MTIFTIDSENHIAAAHGSASEITDKACEPFTSEKELAQLAADCKPRFDSAFARADTMYSVRQGTPDPRQGNNPTCFDSDSVL